MLGSWREIQDSWREIQDSRFLEGDSGFRILGGRFRILGGLKIFPGGNFFEKRLEIFRENFFSTEQHRRVRLIVYLYLDLTLPGPRFDDR